MDAAVQVLTVFLANAVVAAQDEETDTTYAKLQEQITQAVRSAGRDVILEVGVLRAARLWDVRSSAPARG